MSMPDVLLLFDIDGTLTDSAGLTRVALDKAALHLFGIERGTQGITSYGLTDPLIFRKIVENNQLKFPNWEYTFSKFCNIYVAYLDQLLNQSSSVKTHPGIKELLSAIAKLPFFFLALGTGNIRASAMVKLKRHGIDGYFPVGGFGDDSEDRAEIIKVAYHRACEHYRKNFDPEWTWVIGDTPYDIFAGKAWGFRTMAVATGFYTVEELSEYSPTIIFPHLEDVNLVIKTFTSPLKELKDMAIVKKGRIAESRRNRSDDL
ncbi:MAG: HAD family hydrolase [bacterium]